MENDIKISFAGDLFLSNPGKVHIGKRLKRLLDECCFNAVNFEGPLLMEGCNAILKSGPTLYQNENAAEWVRENGWNIISLANNHIMDYGEKSLYKTIAAFNGLGIVGAGSFSEAYSPYIAKTKNGSSIGIIACTHREFGVADELSSTGCAWICHPEIIRCITETRKQVDILIVFAHAGVEMMTYPLPEWRTIYKSFIDLGCDAVIASHPHVPQGKEQYKGKNIIYSLGNLCFQKSGTCPEMWNKGLICEFTFNQNGEGRCITHAIKYDTKTGILDIIDNYDDFQEQIKQFDSVLLNDTLYNSIINKELERHKADYQHLFALSGLISDPLSKDMLKSIKRRICGQGYNMTHLLNNLQNESHRWAIERLLRNNL